MQAHINALKASNGGVLPFLNKQQSPLVECLLPSFNVTTSLSEADYALLKPPVDAQKIADWFNENSRFIQLPSKMKVSSEFNFYGTMPYQTNKSSDKGLRYFGRQNLKQQINNQT